MTTPQWCMPSTETGIFHPRINAGEANRLAGSSTPPVKTTWADPSTGGSLLPHQHRRNNIRPNTVINSAPKPPCSWIQSVQWSRYGKQRRAAVACRSPSANFGELLLSPQCPYGQLRKSAAGRSSQMSPSSGGVGTRGIAAIADLSPASAAA